MPDNPLLTQLYCPYCCLDIPQAEVATHVYSAEHLAKVKALRRTAAYRNRQGDLPDFHRPAPPQR